MVKKTSLWGEQSPGATRPVSHSKVLLIVFLFDYLPIMGINQIMRPSTLRRFLFQFIIDVPSVLFEDGPDVIGREIPVGFPRVFLGDLPRLSFRRFLAFPPEGFPVAGRRDQASRKDQKKGSYVLSRHLFSKASCRSRGRETPPKNAGRPCFAGISRTAPKIRDGQQFSGRASLPRAGRPAARSASHSDTSGSRKDQPDGHAQSSWADLLK